MLLLNQDISAVRGWQHNAAIGCVCLSESTCSYPKPKVGQRPMDYAP